MENSKTITIKTHAKWILTGEHAIIRGFPALVFPLLTKHLELIFFPHKKQTVSNMSPEKIDFAPIINKISQHCSRYLLHSPYEFSGKIAINNQIPIGTGLGFSAALCVAFSQLLVHLKLINKYKLFTVAKNLEDIFHGKSSGIDIAGVLANRGVFYEPGKKAVPLNCNWKPHLTLSFTNQHSNTCDCVKKVEILRQINPEYADLIDKDMAASTRMAKKALELNLNDGQKLLKEAIDLGLQCFESWGLITDSMRRSIDNLKAHNAYAVKPIGSGGGGYVLSLWIDPPPPELRNTLMPILMN